MKTVRIGAGLGFYGDSWLPIKASLERGEVSYIASDHLAELTLAILQKDRQRDASLGYARDIVPMLARLDSAHGPLAARPDDADEINEVWVRLVLRTGDKGAAAGFGRLFPWMGLSGPAGPCGPGTPC